MTVFIYYTGKNQIGFTQLFVALQPQLSKNDDIYVVDVSPNRSGLSLIKRYGSNRSFIFVEVGNHTEEKARDFAWQNALENKQESFLVLNENCVISHNLIANSKNGFSQTQQIIVPNVVLEQNNTFPSNFSWYPQYTRDLPPALINSFCCLYPTKNEPYKCLLLSREIVVVVFPN